MSDNSALTHLATGRLILEEGIPRHDPFSFTAAGEPWTVYSWLASVVYALAERAAGANGLQLVRALLATILAAAAWRLTAPAGALAGRILAVASILVIGTSAWTERPLLIALVLLGVVVLLAEQEGRPRPLVMAGTMWVWVNVHGTFPLALVYLGTRLLGRRLDGLPAGRLRTLTFAALAGTLAGALNPLGPRLLVFPFRLLARHDLLQHVQEWRSPRFSDPPNLAFLFVLLAALVLGTRRRSFEDALVAAVFGASAALGVRNVPFAALVLMPVLARGLTGFGTAHGGERNAVTAAGTLSIGVAACALLVTSWRAPAYDLDRYPVRQVRWMQEQGLLQRRVATQDFVGNYLIARRGREANVFFDDRYDLYPRPVIRDAIALHNGDEGWQRRLDTYGIEVVLWERSRPLASLVSLDPGWRVVRRDARWVVAVRRAEGPSRRSAS